jgi:hypothetical protein
MRQDMGGAWEEFAALLGTLPNSDGAGGETLLVLVLVGLLAALLVEGCALLDARVVALELDTGVGREVKDMLHDFAMTC